METISLKMESELLYEMDGTLKSHRYSTRTEFIRDAIRCKLTSLEKEDIIKKLAAMKGSLKGKAKIDNDRKVREMVSKELEEEYGLK